MAARLVLVHSPLVGSATWDLVAADLAGRGWRVGVPDLTGSTMAGPPYCVRQAEVIARRARAKRLHRDAVNGDFAVTSRSTGQSQTCSDQDFQLPRQDSNLEPAG